MMQPFSPLTRSWFANQFTEPPPVQAAGWAAIAGGEHALLIAPTGRVDDVERNLRGPLIGLKHEAERLGEAVRRREVAIRTGDTPEDRGHAKTAKTGVRSSMLRGVGASGSRCRGRRGSVRGGSVIAIQAINAPDTETPKRLS
jgi:hypothetical protein